jgi:hypothetical protein
MTKTTIFLALVVIVALIIAMIHANTPAPTPWHDGSAPPKVYRFSTCSWVDCRRA